MSIGGAGGFELFRYISPPLNDPKNIDRAKQFAEEFMHGRFFVDSQNRNGSGSYFVPFKGTWGSSDDVIIQAVFRPEANVIGYDKLRELMIADGYDPSIPGGYNPGHYAAAKGYDGYFIFDEGAQTFMTVVLNRTALAVLDKIEVPGEGVHK
jgi:hypothetical protein